MMSILRRSTVLALIVLGITAVNLGLARRDVSVFQKPIPAGKHDLQEIQRAAKEVARSVVPCTVGLQVGFAQGSGVVVSQDGYVLTAAHVAGGPEREAEIRFSDGTTMRGMTLGLHTALDAGLIKIDISGNEAETKLPFAPLAPSDNRVQPGDWCLSTGHPRGFQTERSAPVRLGRIIDVRGDVLRSDCPIAGGDSGGPLFNMRGQVIGIHSRISEDVTVNLHAPVLACLDVWDELKQAQVLPRRPVSKFFDRLDVNHDGKIDRSELPEGLERRVFDRLAERFELDSDSSNSIDDLTEKLGWSARPVSDFGQRYSSEGRVDESLLPRLFVRGREIKDAFAPQARAVDGAVVQIKCDGLPVALGTVVGGDGWIMTKASELNDKPRCKLSDGREFSARVVGTDRQHDLALLRIDVDDLRAVKWAVSPELQPGAWLITPNLGEVLSLGVVSVSARHIEGVPGVLGVMLHRSGTRVDQVFRNSGAADAGIVAQDVIIRIMDHAVANIDQVRERLSEYRAGDVVQATITRNDRELTLDVTLGSPEDVFFRFGRGGLQGRLSRRRDDFPEAVQHDTVLEPTACGGPVLNLDGEAVGINIARAGRIATYLIPSGEVQRIMKTIRADAKTSSSSSDA